MHRGTPAYSPGQREVWFGSVEWAEAAARDFQQRGYRRRTRGLVPGDVLVAETAEGFSLFWIPQDQCAPPSPVRGECVWEKGPGDEGPGEAGVSFSPSPGGWVGDGRGGQGVRSRAGAPA